MKISEKIGDIFFLSKKKRKKNEDMEKRDTAKEQMLCRFVLDGAGKKVGESIAINDDILIIKADDKYLGVPLKHVEEEGKTLLVKGLVDRVKAEEMGEKWRHESFQEIQYPEEEKDGL